MSVVGSGVQWRGLPYGWRMEDRKKNDGIGRDVCSAGEVNKIEAVL